MTLKTIAAKATIVIALGVAALGLGTGLTNAQPIDKPCNPVNNPISSHQPDQCMDNPAADGCMSGPPQGPGDIRCIADPCNGVCTGGPYAVGCG